MKVQCDERDCNYNENGECMKDEIDVGKSGCWCYQSTKKSVPQFPFAQGQIKETLGVEFHRKTYRFVVETLTSVNGRSPSKDNVDSVVNKITKAFKPMLKEKPDDQK